MLDEANLVRDTLRRVLADHGPSELLGALAELGVFDLLAEDPATLWSALFSEQGRACVSSPALDLVVLDALGQRATDVAVVYPSFVRSTAPAGRRVGSIVSVDGLLLSGAQRASSLVVPVAGEGGDVALASVALGTESLQERNVQGFDPDLGLTAIEGALNVPSLEPLAPGAWETALARAQRALAQELTGVAEALLDLAIGHVTSREQFGAPIAVFQAVKHRLADVHVAVASSRSALDAAWSSDEANLVDLAALAKILAGQAFMLAARHCQQVCGGIGFTWEFGLHRYVRRGMLLDGFLGSSDAGRAEVAARALATGSVARVGDLLGEGLGASDYVT